MTVETPAPLLIFKLGSTRPELAARIGDYEDWIEQAVAGSGLPVTTLDAHACDTLPRPDTLAGVILTGSNHMVTDREAWSERLRLWLQTAVRGEVPIFAICYGHQLLADAYGGTVQARPHGVGIGTTVMERTAAAQTDPLFGTLPRRFPAHTIHWQTVTALPEAALRLVHSELDANQAWRIGPCAWGVQFHPEFPTEAMRFLVQHHRVRLEEAGLDVADVLAAIVPTPAASALLPRFADFCRERWAERQR